MNGIVSFYLLTVVLLFTETRTVSSKLMNFCYFTNWSNKLASFDARFDIRDINVTLCSHLIYAFAKIDASNVRLSPTQNDDDNGQLVNKKGRYFDFNKLKIEHPNLVTLLSIGGAWAGSGGFVSIVRSPETMKLFSRNVAIYLRDRDFDGIDIDWEWPGDTYRNKYTTLLEIMRCEFEKESNRTSKKRLLISITVAAWEEVITSSYNISSISGYVDYIQIMAYDFHGPWSYVTSFSSPLFSRLSNPGFHQQLSQAWAVDRWISGGAPRNKLVMGLTSTAISFALSNRTLNDVGSPVDGAGKKGPYLGVEGHVTYYRVCEMIKYGAIHRWDDEQKMAYAYLDDQWVGYGNPKSMKEKVKFAYSRGIAGVMFWTLDQDDFLGHYCNNGKYPLLTAIYNAINELAPTQSPFVNDVSTSSTHSTTPKDFILYNSTDKSGLDVQLIPTSTETGGSGSGISKPKSKLKTFCYFTNWSNKLASFDAKFDIRDINVTLCSHLIYAFANIDASYVRLTASQNDDDNGQLVNKKGRYFDFNKLKIEHPNLVTLLSIGGASAGIGGFVSIVRSPETMKLFSRNVAIYLRDRDFDGINVDWEWPDDIYRNKYAQLLKIMRREFEKEAVRTSKTRLLISIDVAVGEETITNSYNISSISRDVDYIQIMAYDFHGPWSDVTSFTAPLFSRTSNPRFNQQLSQAWAVDRWISGGAPRNKLIMGLTSTATSFTLSNRTVTDVGSPVDGAGKKGPYLGFEGHVTYYRVCEMIKYGAIHRWDDEQKMAYAYLDDQWVGYGNPKSMKEKVKFAYSRGIAGVMFWTLDQDDFLGHYCNNGEYPLLTAIHNAINELTITHSQFVDGVSTSSTHSSTPKDTRLNNSTDKSGPGVQLIPTSTETVGSGSGISKPKSKLKTFCYFTNWSNKLASFDARFDIRDINVTLCSHLIYAFAKIDASNFRLSPSQNDDDNCQLYNKKGRYFDFNKLKVDYPNIVTLLSIGGASAGSCGFVQIVNSPGTMKLFSRNVAIYLRDHDFDGIDIDWEWPDYIYRNKYTQLLKTMRREFEEEAVRRSRKRLLISITVAAWEETITRSYNISSISGEVDYIQITAYDFHGPWSDVTGFSDPLFPRLSNSRFNPQHNQAWAVNRWISGGAPRNKLIMGLTGTATSFALSNRTVTDVGSPVDGPGTPGPYLNNAGHVTYYRVCEMIKNGAINRWDDEQKMAFAYLDDQWVGYGNPKSIKEKVKFAYSRGIAGVTFWTLDQDDFLGYYCNDGEYPLLTAIHNAIHDLAPTQSPFVDDKRTSTTHSTTPKDFRLHNSTDKSGHDVQLIPISTATGSGSGISKPKSTLKNFCYFTNWSNKFASFDARFDIRDINVTLCSHLIYAFAKIDASNVRLTPSQNDDDNGQLVTKKGRYFDFNKLKIEHPNLVTLLSIGGASAGSGGFVSIVRSPETMKLFSRNVAIYLRDRDFDGIDIDWEWPDDIYRNKFTQLLKIMRLEFEQEAVRTSKKRLLISIAVAVGEETITSSYNISSISRDVDYIQIMAFDFHGPWSDVTSFTAPLFSRLSNPRFNQQLSQAWAVDRWISGGAPRNKLIMGLTSTATSFTLSNRTVTDVGSPVDGAGKKGPYLGDKGHVTYYRVCEMIKNGAIHRWDDEQKMAYAYLDDQWVGYGNPKSMKEKVKFAYSRGIAGVTFWTLDRDDFLGHYCNDGEYPLLTAIYNAINELAPTQSQFVDDVSTSTTISTTPVDLRVQKRNEV
ncbi:uncharacterized protein LOC132758983 isoform X2 [Ruditapes philippinarum]|uniref:uncharacterized protein LOC132758983 isoform X2 n=1 Tax=Ruditapes philippinarum TaxID=129788 RepID=UPI00295B778F|nr:uncharacterized protein LOC132758983 isoform X2 [Ruditapes philippinarum]